MMRVVLRGWGLVWLTVCLAGCAGDQSGVRLEQIEAANRRLSQQVGELSAARGQLQADLDRAVAERDNARERAKEWKSRSDAAAEQTARDGVGVPPSVKAELEAIARPSRYWRYSSGLLRGSCSVLFDAGKPELNPGGVAAIREVAPGLKKLLGEGRYVLEVWGLGNDELMNHRFPHVAEERAVAVREALIGEGIPAESMYVVGGGSRPIPGATPETNRRIELVVRPAPPEPTP